VSPRPGMTPIPLTGGEPESSSFPEFSGWRRMGVDPAPATTVAPTPDPVKTDVPTMSVQEAKQYMSDMAKHFMDGVEQVIKQAVQDGQLSPSDLRNKTKLQNFLSPRGGVATGLKNEYGPTREVVADGSSQNLPIETLDVILTKLAASNLDKISVPGHPGLAVQFMPSTKFLPWVLNQYVTNPVMTQALKTLSQELGKGQKETRKLVTFVDLANTIYSLYTQQYKMFLGVALTGVFTGKQEQKSWLDRLTNLFFSQEEQAKYKPKIPEWMAQGGDESNNYGWSDPKLQDPDMVPPDVARALGSRKAFQAKYPKVDQQVTAALGNTAVLDSPSFLLSFGAYAFQKVMQALPSYAQGRSPVEVKAALAYLAGEPFPETAEDEENLRKFVQAKSVKTAAESAPVDMKEDPQVPTLIRQFQEITSAGMKGIPTNMQNIIFKTAFETVKITSSGVTTKEPVEPKPRTPKTPRTPTKSEVKKTTPYLPGFAP